MPACQISFTEFARSLSEAFFPAAPAAAPSTPPVQQAAVEVVAHPVAVGGGECIVVFEGAWVPRRGLRFAEQRMDYGFALDAAWAGGGMDAPLFVPSGSHRPLDCGDGHFRSSGVMYRGGC